MSKGMQEYKDYDKMGSLPSSTNMVTGEYVSQVHPHTVVTIKDNSATAIPDVTTFGYSVLQPIYSQKGITNRMIAMKGDDVLTKYDKLFGTGNTNIYGPMSTYARRALEGGFALNTINVAPEDATHANFYVSFVIKPATEEGFMYDEATDSNIAVTRAIEQEVYCVKSADTGYYKFSLSEDDFTEEEQASVETLYLPKMKVGFEVRHVTNCRSGYDSDKFLSETDVKTELPIDNDLTKIAINIPVFGLFYEGATEYGNNFKAVISATGVEVNSIYRLYKCTILDGETEEYSFNFTLFDIQHEMVSTSFKDRANKKCKMEFGPNNSLRIFKPYLLKRKLANKVKRIVPQVTSLIVDNFVTAIKEVYPEFDKDTSHSNFSELSSRVKSLVYQYRTQDNEIGRTLETPFSYVNPFDDLYYYGPVNDNSLVERATISSIIPFEGGSSGELKEILNEEEFDWNIRYADDNPSDTPVFIKMFVDVFTGVTDRSIFDQALVSDSLICGDTYPIEVQMAIEDLCRYKPEIIYNDKTRPDMTYFRTPQNSITDFDGVLDWYETMDNIPDGHNHNCKLIIGRGYFEDATTGGQNEFSLIYDWFGPNSSLASWLNSGTGDSFASDSWSDITSMVDGTETMIPASDEREVLSTKDINYFTRKSDRTLSLGEDTAMYYGYVSILKNIGTTLHFNNIITACTLIARDNPIIDPTEDNINKIIRKMLKAAAIPAKHFGNTLTIEAAISTHEMEANKNVVVYNISVEKGLYSRQNRIVANANLPTTD